MRLSKVGEYIELNENRNSNLELGIDDVMGMTITKEIIPTKADIKEKELPKFYVCEPFDFIYNPRTHGKRIGLGFNTLNKKFLISWNNIAFRVKKQKLSQLEPYYLFIWLNRNEWDRNATFRSWGSSTEVFSWEEFCDMDIELPDIEIQRKYVAIYKAMQHNLKVYESKLEDLKTAYIGKMETMKYDGTRKLRIGDYLREKTKKNIERLDYEICGVKKDRTFIPTIANVNLNNLASYKLVNVNDFAYSNRINIGSIALRYETNCMVSPSYTVFEVTDHSVILPEYLSMWFVRDEFCHFAFFYSMGSVKDELDFAELSDMIIPVPTVKEQEYILKIYHAYKKRTMIVEQLKESISNICPILIAGAIKEAKEYA